jgi:predicted GIY-YIG superfamily endonuclease
VCWRAIKGYPVARESRLAEFGGLPENTGVGLRLVLMPPMQPLLFPDPKPLVERLGRDFFRELPRKAGVYLMRDGAGTILYIGKAKSLRQRLGSYRVANPDRVPKRLLRLLHAVEKIEYQECPDEAAALRREAELLRELKPRFNRAGVWPAPPKVLAWKRAGDSLELALFNNAPEGWNHHHVTKGGAAMMLVSLVRLFWVVACPERGLAGMPAGWFHGHLPEQLSLPAQASLLEDCLRSFITGEASAPFLDLRQFGGWQSIVLTEDLETVTRYLRPPVARLG